jgi:4-aminobutyrate aminotransferase
VSNPHIKTELPGPKAKAMIDRDSQVISPSYPRDYPFVMSHGRGMEVWDVDGNRFLDFAAGIAVCSTGHAHPQVVGAIREAAGKFVHISSDYWHEEMIGLAERLARVAPFGEPAMSFFCQSGTESVEGALKLARYVTGRPRFIGFLGGFHGRTMGSLSFTSSKYTQQKGFAPTMPGVTHVPYPNSYRPLFAGADQGEAVLDYIRMRCWSSRSRAKGVISSRPKASSPGCARCATSTASSSSSMRCNPAWGARARCSPASISACARTS